MRRIVFSVWLLWVAALLSMESAVSAAATAPATAHRLVAESDTPAPGETVTLALVITPKAGWHGYWQNPGDVGAPDTIKWDLPQGVSAGPLRYPVPKPKLRSGIMNFVYEGRYAILADLKLSPSLRAGAALPVRADLTFLACTDDMCVPQRADFETVLHVADTPLPHLRVAEFDEYRRALPLPLGTEAHFNAANERFRLSVPIPSTISVSNAYFFPLTDGALVYSSPQHIWRNSDQLLIEAEAGRSATSLHRIEGVLSIGNRAFSLSAVRTAHSAAEEGALDWQSIVLAFGGALLGGLLLNAMPCVFPILSLKALSLAKAGTSEGRREAAAYTLGSVLACLGLGTLLLALRASGVAVGWAFQLQNPWVVLALLLLTAAIALNLAGLFELPPIITGDRLTRTPGAAGAFWTGALAGFIATPCTGPFMGAALGAALLFPAPAALSIFGGLGLGLALPFLLIACVPAFRRKLPRPGSWMVRLRAILAVPMAFTALWLAWVLVHEVDRRPAAEVQPSGKLRAERFSEARLAALRAEGRPVFVYFTADWCVTCKVNESVALDRDEVRRAFAAGRVAVLVGDWTNGNPSITRFLEEQGRSGVPLYLWYAPHKPARILPQILTPSTLTDLVKEGE